MPAYLCNKCDRIARVPAPTPCPTCHGAVVEVDVSLDILACPTCEYFMVGRLEPHVRAAARCARCKRGLKRINRAEATDATGRRVPRIDPPSRWVLLAGGVYLGVVIDVLLALIAVAILGVNVPWHVKAEATLLAPVAAYMAWRAIAEMRETVSDPRVLANHAIEHACIALLDQEGREMWWGHSGRSGFWVSGNAGREDVERAASAAIERLLGDAPDLRIHPCCGGRFLIDVLLSTATAVLLPAAVIGTVLKPALWPLILVMPAAWLLRGPITSLLQRFGTTTARFSSARVESVKRREEAYFVTTTITF